MQQFLKSSLQVTPGKHKANTMCAVSVIVCCFCH